MAKENFQAIFDQLKPILQKHAAGMTVIADAPGDYVLDSTRVGPNGKPLFFGAVKVSKSYVSFHLMPVYMHPELLEGLSPALRKRMQGKSCFNFKSLDAAVLQELSDLTERSIARV